MSGTSTDFGVPQHTLESRLNEETRALNQDHTHRHGGIDQALPPIRIASNKKHIRPSVPEA